jgi:RNA polymerase sigma factor (sigma-70 family)
MCNPFKKIDDEQLMSLFQQGDVLAFNELYDRYYKRVLHFLFRFNINATDCEDLVQETFLRVYKSRDSYNHSSKFSTWLYTIAQNLSYTSYRKKVRMDLINFHTDELQQSQEVSQVIQNDEFDPDLVFERKVVREVFDRALKTISNDFQEVVVLRDLEGLSYEEISDKTGMPMGTVKSKINRGRHQLQQRMGKLITDKPRRSKALSPKFNHV